jgi:hypothetical protein
MRIGFALLGLAVAAFAACKPGYAPVASTSELLRQPALAAEADALGDEERVESERIGAAGAPSCAYAKFAALLAKVTPAEEVALLRHRSPIVRGYVARHLARAEYGEVQSLSPEAAVGLRPILRDDTVVGFVDGCFVSEAPIGEYVVLQLCERRDRTSRALLDELVASGHPRAQVVRECRGVYRPSWF